MVKASLLLVLLRLFLLLLLLLPVLFVLLLSLLLFLDPGIWLSSLYISWSGCAAAFVFAQVGLRWGHERKGSVLLANNAQERSTHGIPAPILDWVLCCHGDEGLAASCCFYGQLPFFPIL